MALTNKQRAFIDEYLQCWNSAEAARRAGYSERTARSQGHRLLTNVDISEEIQQRIADRAMDADEALELIASHARGSIGDFIDVVGRLAIINLEKAEAAGKLHLIKKLKYNALGVPEIELYDAQSALQLIGRHHGLFKDVTENHTTLDIADDPREQILRQLDRIASTRETNGSGDEPDAGASVNTST